MVSVVDDKLLGIRIKAIRKQRGLTLQNLADKSGLSTAFISKAERGLTSPTFSALLEICKALDVDIVDLTQSFEDKKVVIRKHERLEMYPLADGLVKYEFTTQRSRKMKGLWLTLQPGGMTVSRGHSEEEMGIVIKGKLKVILGKETYFVEEGDSLYIDAHVQHSLKNVGDCKCLCFFSISHSY
jgi:transcriptional regulator with XRE-family HTH domain